MRTETVHCAGPHVEPVELYTVQVPDDVTLPAPHRALCADCGEVYRTAVADPDMIENGAGELVANPDKIPPGQIPSAALVERIKRRRVPDWVNPPRNYRNGTGNP